MIRLNKGKFAFISHKQNYELYITNRFAIYAIHIYYIYCIYQRQVLKECFASNESMIIIIE